MRVAAVDVGTNTVRLLVRDGDETITRESRITRLGQGVDASGELGAKPMDRTLAAVQDFVARARAAGAERLRIAGTSALRDASNRRTFAERVERASGTPLEILEGAEEGRLAYVGATGWLGPGAYVVCDIGGGSTELISESDEMSADVGSVRVRERYLRGDPPSAESVEMARSAVEAVLIGLSAPKRFPTGRLVGVAGTITTLAALDAGLTTYDSDIVHGHLLSVRAVQDWSDRLNQSSAADIRSMGPVAPGRADVIGAGALILSVVMEVLDRGALTVSEQDILDGLVLDTVG